jgi:hypothetical protein
MNKVQEKYTKFLPEAQSLVTDTMQKCTSRFYGKNEA